MITSFKIFESNLEIEKVCRSFGIENFQIVDGLVNVDGDVDLYNKNLEKLPLKFGMVSGYFDCSNNQLTSLDGAPQSIGGYFDCGSNKLTSLEGAPQNVGGYFSCNNNQLTSLEGAQSIGEDFYCSNNKLTSLEGAPQSIGGDFYCSNNKLTSLEGAPKSIGGDFQCPNNQLTKFTGIPEYSLNEDRDFHCIGNPIYEIYRLFGTPKCIDLINEYGVIGDGVISRVRLEEVFVELGLEIPKNLEFKNYKLIG